MERFSRNNRRDCWIALIRFVQPVTGPERHCSASRFYRVILYERHDVRGAVRFLVHSVLPYQPTGLTRFASPMCAETHTAFGRSCGTRG